MDEKTVGGYDTQWQMYMIWIKIYAGSSTSTM